MDFALSTHWNAGRHAHGEAVIEEILELGFRQVELGYDLRSDQAPGIRKWVAQGAIQVVSVHAPCPIPLGALRGHPELATLCEPDAQRRALARDYLERTIAFAAEIGADRVVAHAGRLDMVHRTPELIALHAAGAGFSPKAERLRDKLQARRERLVAPYLERLAAGIEALLPRLQAMGVRLAFENLPSWEAIPTELETSQLLERFPDPHFGAWYDMGHGQIRHTLFLINQRRWLARWQDRVLGWHVHDVAFPAEDHQMPPGGLVDFSGLKVYAQTPGPKVIEAAPGTPADAVRAARVWLQETWGATKQEGAEPPAAPDSAHKELI
ncbi:MAG: sugar phosphate isomerase/epimerase [Candidatus Marinimicrobia bacterium]|nr:sugar phosphate isomerase/epimerase [Candidatus Neomarinimicrobiota bacterium]